MQLPLFLKDMHWLKENWFKLSIILIVFLTGLSMAVYFLVYIPSQNEVKRLDVLRKEEQARLDKEEKENKEYIAKRKNDCFGIYDKEKANWNNVKDMEYDSKEDICYVIYKDQSGKVADCESISPKSLEITWDSPFWKSTFNGYIDCKEKQFRKEF